MLEALKEENKMLCQGNLALLAQIKDLEARVSCNVVATADSSATAAAQAEHEKLCQANTSLCSTIRDLQHTMEEQHAYIADLELQNLHLRACSATPWLGNQMHSNEVQVQRAQIDA
eukprot:8540617-Karenia_brevis.AAC.1